MYENPIDVIRDQELAARGLPEVAYVDNSERIYGDSQIIAIKRGESGYYPIYTPLAAEELNDKASVTAAQVEAMLMGSMFGWHTKGAFPQTHQDRLGRSGKGAVNG